MSWDDEAPTWDENVAVRAYSKAAFASLEQLCAERGLALAGARVLDFGCGTGLLTEAVARTAREVVAIDISPAMIEVLRGKIRERGLGNIEAVVGELAELGSEQGLGEGSFDLVTCSSVCAFLEDYPAAVSLLAAKLKPGGLFVQWDWELNPEDEEPFGLTAAGIQAALEAAGLGEITVDIGFSEPFEGAVMEPLRGAARKR